MEILIGLGIAALLGIGLVVGPVGPGEVASSPITLQPQQAIVVRQGASQPVLNTANAIRLEAGQRVFVRVVKPAAELGLSNANMDELVRLSDIQRLPISGTVMVESSRYVSGGRLGEELTQTFYTEGAGLAGMVAIREVSTQPREGWLTGTIRYGGDLVTVYYRNLVASTFGLDIPGNAGSFNVMLRNQRNLQVANVLIPFGIEQAALGANGSNR